MPPCCRAEADRWPRWPAPGCAADPPRSLKPARSAGLPRLPDAPVRCSPELRSLRRGPGAPLACRPEPRSPGAPVSGRPDSRPPRAPAAPGVLGAPVRRAAEPRSPDAAARRPLESRVPGAPAGPALPPLPEPGRPRIAPRWLEPVRASGEPRPAESVGRRAVPRPAESVARRAGGVSGSSARSLRRSPGESPESARRFQRPPAEPARSGRPPALPATSSLHQSQIRPRWPSAAFGQTTHHRGLCPLSRSMSACLSAARLPTPFASITNALRAVTLW